MLRQCSYRRLVARFVPLLAQRGLSRGLRLSFADVRLQKAISTPFIRVCLVCRVPTDVCWRRTHLKTDAGLGFRGAIICGVGNCFMITRSSAAVLRIVASTGHRLLCPFCVTRTPGRLCEQWNKYGVMWFTNRWLDLSIRLTCSLNGLAEGVGELSKVEIELSL